MNMRLRPNATDTGTLRFWMLVRLVAAITISVTALVTVLCLASPHGDLMSFFLLLGILFGLISVPFGRSTIGELNRSEPDSFLWGCSFAGCVACGLLSVFFIVCAVLAFFGLVT